MTTTFPALKAAEEKLAAKQKELADVFAEAGPDMDMSKVKSIDGDSKAKVDWIRAKNAEIDEASEAAEGLRAVKAAADRSKARGEGGESGAEPGHARNTDLERKAQLKSIGQLFTESAAYKGRQGSTGPEVHLDVELKALFETGAGWEPETTRTGRVVPYATRPIQVTDLIPANSTSQSAIVYMEETVFTNNAAEILEGGQYPEARLELTERESLVRKIGTWLPVTDEQLEDEPQARGYINNRLPFMLRQRLDYQILQGNGTAPNLRGFNNVSGILTQAKGSDPVPDAVYKAMTKVRVTGQAMPNLVIMHPNDWQDIRLLRTADGIYIWGSPAEAGPARLWGLPVAEAQAQTENTGLVLDTSFTELATRRGIDTQITNAHADFFINGKQAIRCDIRVALTVYRPAAICTVTSI